MLLAKSLFIDAICEFSKLRESNVKATNLASLNVSIYWAGLMPNSPAPRRTFCNAMVGNSKFVELAHVE